MAVVICALANRVLYKMALVPLGNYIFFLAQLQTFGYVAVYFAVLYWRYRSVANRPANGSIIRCIGQEL